MPYIQVRAFPKDEETKQRVAQRIKQVFLEEWGCPEKAITVSIEAVEKEQWAETVRKPIIEANLDKMLILDGEEKF